LKKIEYNVKKEMKNINSGEYKLMNLKDNKERNMENQEMNRILDHLLPIKILFRMKKMKKKLNN
jgi:hypothetical protein